MTASFQPLEPLLEQIGSGTGSEALRTRAAGRLMTLLENEPHRLPQLLRAAGTRRSEPRLILGVTGAPGSGKSTLTDAIIAVYRQREPGLRVGVIAVDPSSPFSGGAVLGDRIRMMQHATDPMVFVRSLASRGHLGGLALGVKGVLRVMGLLGIDLVIIETVGVGQSEVEVVRVADEVIVVLAPGQGDSVQLLKAGLMEIGEFIVINKADREGADELHNQVLTALKLETGDSPRHVALVSAVERRGVDELVDAVEAGALARSEQKTARRTAGRRHDIRDAILEAAKARLLQVLEHDPAIRPSLEAVFEGTGAADAESLLQSLLTRAAALESPSSL